MKSIDDLIQIVIKSAYKVHNALGAGFLEKVYEKALCIELRKNGLNVASQYPIEVYYDNTLIGDYFADLLVEDCLIVEIKAVENLSIAHEKQIINYLAATGIDDGLLLNFGSSVNVKRKYRVYTKKH